MTERSEMEGVLEAVLFAATEPVPPQTLLAVFPPGEREEAEAALASVRDRYREPQGRGIMIEEVGGGLRLVTRPELHGYLKKFFAASATTRLSMAALETLAIVAYRQPVTAPEIQELRGVNTAGVLKTLLERRLIRISGRKEVVGRPFLYRTSREFLMQFGLARLDDLPPLEEFEESLGGDDGFDPAHLEGDREEAVLREAAQLEEGEEEDDEPAPSPDAEPEGGAG